MSAFHSHLCWASSGCLTQDAAAGSFCSLCSLSSSKTFLQCSLFQLSSCCQRSSQIFPRRFINTTHIVLAFNIQHSREFFWVFFYVGFCVIFARHTGHEGVVSTERGNNQCRGCRHFSQTSLMGAILSAFARLSHGS